MPDFKCVKILFYYYTSGEFKKYNDHYYLHAIEKSLVCISSEVIAVSFSDGCNEMSITVNKHYTEINPVLHFNMVFAFRLLSVIKYSPVSCVFERGFV